MRIVLKIDDSTALAAHIRQRMQATGLPQASVARMMLFQALAAPANAPTPEPEPQQGDDDNAILDGLLNGIGG